MTNLFTPFECRLVGLSPLLQNSEITVDALNPAVQAHKQLTKKAKKTEADLEACKKSEWLLAGHREDDRPVVPVDWILAALKEAARKTKQGKLVQGGVFPVCSSFPIEYEGPKGLEEMWASERFIDYRGVRNNGSSRIMRARPRFDQWSIVVRLDVSESVISCPDLLRFMELAGAMIGIGDYRPKFGRFAVEALASKKAA